ncbi:hypothetical protein P8C59_009163 [Phyllachora maydis]|uniref:Non-structural maintenance of chromosomes element 4 n=1 Tax=Phyllachora maydis TaxID=1825666 RepID=A0AAD9MHZ6_9PEZI|nr:hypothetical protein P8C59_009163 [Phyllachora maydis]
MRSLNIPSRSSSAAAATRRKRTPPAHQPADQNDDPASTSTSSRRRQRRRTREPSVPAAADDDDDDGYDPNQSKEDQRRLALKLRAKQRALADGADALMGDTAQMMAFWRGCDDDFRHVKVPNMAAIDARTLVMAADVAAKGVQRLLLGGAGAGAGVDVDDFLAKCTSFMQRGAGADAADDDENNGDMYNWAHLGRHAAVPSARRPGLAGFLLGPLSVAKKARKAGPRAAPLRRDQAAAVRPQALRPEDVARSEKNDLTVICRRIHKQLREAQERAQERAEAELDAAGAELSSAQVDLVLDAHGLRPTGGIDLMRFVVHPGSFGQTVENLFYVSFLIREGTVKMAFGEDGLPSIESVVKPEGGPGQDEGPAAAKNPLRRHQAVMAIDMDIWRDLIDAFDIKTPMIEHREEQAQETPGARGWYQ